MKSFLLAFSFLSLISSQNGVAQEAAIGGCRASDFVADPSPSVKIMTNGASYTPKCLKVKKGTVAVIDASSSHPLQGIPGTNTVNPIYDELGGAVSPKTVTFTQAGTFGYYCIAHGDDTGAGMAGAILVE